MIHKTLKEKKLSLIQGLLLLEDETIINKIDGLIKKGLSYTSDEKKVLSFEVQNKQFEGNTDLNEFVEEYKMPLGEFRKATYEAEFSENMSLAEFFEIL